MSFDEVLLDLTAAVVFLIYFHKICMYMISRAIYLVYYIPGAYIPGTYILHIPLSVRVCCSVLCQGVVGEKCLTGGGRPKMKKGDTTCVRMRIQVIKKGP